MCDHLAAHLDDLQQRELLRRRTELELVFKHAITQDVTYHSLLVSRRRELHRVTARGDLYASSRISSRSCPGTLAHHYGEGRRPGRSLALPRHRSRGALRRPTPTLRRSRSTVPHWTRPKRQVSARRAIPSRGTRRPPPTITGQHSRSPGGVRRGSGRRAAGGRPRARAPAPARGQDLGGRAPLRRGGAGVQRTVELALGEHPPDSDVAWWQEWVQIQADLIWLGVLGQSHRGHDLGSWPTLGPSWSASARAGQRGAFFNALLLMELRRGSVCRERRDARLRPRVRGGATRGR